MTSGEKERHAPQKPQPWGTSIKETAPGFSPSQSTSRVFHCVRRRGRCHLQPAQETGRSASACFQLEGNVWDGGRQAQRTCARHVCQARCCQQSSGSLKAGTWWEGNCVLSATVGTSVRAREHRAREEMLLWPTYTKTCFCPGVRPGHSSTSVDVQKHKTLNSESASVPRNVC